MRPMASTASPYWTLAMFLPFTIGLVWPRSHGPSLLVTPFLMGLAAVAIAGLALRPVGQVRSALWLLLVLGVIWMSPWTQPLVLWGTLGAAAAAWVAMSVGHVCATRADVMKAFAYAVILGVVLNVMVAWLQFFDLEELAYPIVSMNGSLRPYGNIRQPNHLATLCVMGLACIWWAGQAGYWRRWAVVLGAAFAMSGLALSGSRAGWMELIATAVFVASWSDGNKRLNRLVFGLAPLWTYLWSLLLQSMSNWFTTAVETVTQRDGASMSRRLEHWHATWNLAISHPTQGVGWGEFRYARFMEEPIITGAEIADNAHSLVLHLLAELGFAGTFLVLAPVVWLLIARQPWRNRQAAVRCAWLVILTVGLHSMVEYPLWYMNFLIPTAIAFGMVMAVRSEPEEHSTVRGSAVVMVSVVLAFATTMAAYDFGRIMPAFMEDGRTVEDPQALLAAQNTWLFGIYADRVLAERVAVTPKNAEVIWKASNRLLHSGPEPLSLWSGLAAQCQLGGGIYASELATRFGQAFPAAYKEFRQLTPPDMLTTCIK